MSGNKNVLITGGFGNLGSWLATWFSENGFTVTIVASQKRHFLDHLNLSVIECDITDAAACESSLSGRSFNFVIHAASVNDTFVDDYANKALKVNTLGTRNVLQALRKEDLINFVYLSTFHVYGVSAGKITEQTPVAPRHDYATTHLFAEYYVKQFHLTHNIPYTILRLTNSYGCPKEKNSSKWYLVLNDLARMAFERKQIVLNSNGQAQRDFIWMGSVCESIGALMKIPAPNDVFNLASGTAFRLIEIAHEVQQAYQEVYGETLEIRTNESDISRHDQILNIDTSKLSALVDLHPKNMFKEEAKNIFRFLERGDG